MDKIVHEQSDISGTDLSEMIKLAKEKQLQKNQDKLNKVEPSKPSTNPTTNNVSHGDFVEMTDGTTGVFIDHTVEAKKLMENDNTSKRLLSLLDSKSVVVDVDTNVNDEYLPEIPEGYDPGEEYIKNNPYDKKAILMKEIKSEFNNLDFGLPGHGLVSKDSPEAKLVKEAMDKLRSGEVILPTPEEYEEQRQRAMERRKQRVEGNQQSTIQNNETIEPEYDTTEDSMGEMPVNPIMKKGVDELLDAINNTNKNETVNEVEGLPVIDRVPVEKAVEVERVPEPTQNAPIDLAGLEEVVDANQKNIQTFTPNRESEDTIKPSEVVEINVQKGEADTVIDSLPIETYNKVVKAKVVKVNEVELKDVPTKTTRITDIASYRKLANRRPHSGTAEITERVLVNSGFVVTLKAATSLEMATIFKSPTSSEVDYEKEYIFCHQHTVGTSIGKLSFNDFVAKVSPRDIETILYGIYEISETDKRTVTINCGLNDGGCGGSYDIDAEINKLPNYDALNDESRTRIKEIIAIKGNLDETRRYAEKSPTSTAKYVKCGDRTLTIRSTTGNMMIERIDRVSDVSETYGPIIAVLLMYVENITITVKEREDAEPINALLDTVELLCEELVTLTDEELTFVKDLITETLEEYPTITYSIKGPCKCPHCGAVKDSIPCSVSDLVFRKAQSVLA